jgi:demethylmenaquinone methyltransferase/2-methoxy-6-polyprenyl-1,4-benzoquinol methylase
LTGSNVIRDRRDTSAPEKRRLVRELFGSISGTYDLADTLLSFGLDSRWRKKAIRLLSPDPGSYVLDACGGTAGLSLLAARRVGPGGCVIVYDFSRPMMDVGKKRTRKSEEGRFVSFVQGDAEDLGLPDGTFDAVTIGFGIRNLARPRKGLNEFLRVLKPGGKLMVLEFSLPVNAWLRGFYRLYSFYWMPLVGRLVCGAAAPFRYLAESIRAFPKPEDIVEDMGKAGFADVRFHRLTNGIAVVYVGVKPGPPAENQERHLTRLASANDPAS